MGRLYTQINLSNGRVVRQQNDELIHLPYFKVPYLKDLDTQSIIRELLIVWSTYHLWGIWSVVFNYFVTMFALFLFSESRSIRFLRWSLSAYPCPYHIFTFFSPFAAQYLVSIQSPFTVLHVNLINFPFGLPISMVVGVRLFVLFTFLI